MTAIAIIPARGGSRRIPRKNIRPFHGKPIIAYSIEAAKKSGLFDVIVVSTDNDDIARIAFDAGAIVHNRPDFLSQDEIGTQEVAEYVLSYLSVLSYSPDFEYACVIYATCPMLTGEDLRDGYEHLVCFNDESAYQYIPGWFYWGRTNAFLSGAPLEKWKPMASPDERYIDINTPADWLRAEQMYQALQDKK